MKSLIELDQLTLDAADKSQLKVWIQTLVSQATETTALLQAKTDEIKRKDFKIEALTFELARLRRIQFGAKNETLSPLQRDIFAETLAADIAAIEVELEQLADVEPCATVAKPKRPRAGRQPLPEHLPRIEHRHEPESCLCGQCGNDLVKIREDITEQLDVEPAKFFVHRHIRPQYACRRCETITAAPIPPAVIDGGMAAVGLLTWIMISKFVDHLPLYRLEQIAARDQVNLARSTLAEWVGRVGVALQPLVDRLIWHLLQGNTLHADETPVSQLAPGSGKTKKAYLWAYRSNDLQAGPRIIVFDYQAGRSGAHARGFLGDWRGHLMVDDYSGYKALFTPNGNNAACVELGCLAHARRKFFDLHKAHQSPMALEALNRIAVLYAIEAEGKDLSIEARKSLRAEKSLLHLTALHAWLLATRAQTASGGGSAKALDYSLKRWTALSRYADSGHLPIDNNPVENCIRPIALGKKNWLFVGSERAGRRAAAIQTLLGTAKLNGLNSAAWLNDTLEKLPTCPNSRIDELLPLAPDVIDALKR
ncbi:MAG: IS66 family transposase, partial [Methylobacter sp.]|nr:IS66 family transposase [Methylobacter sp.]